MVGRRSGLAPDDVEAIRRVADLHHEEMHGGVFTFINDVSMLSAGQTPSIAPKPHEKHRDIAMYMNRFSETNWILLRSLAGLQLAPSAFGARWERRWSLLDDAFRIQVEGLAEMGKLGAAAFIRMMDSKMVMRPNTHAYRAQLGAKG